MNATSRLRLTTVTAALLLSLLGCMPGGAQPPSVQQAMGFEVAGAWLTAPELTDEFPEQALWSTRTMPFKQLAGGVKLSTEHVKQGRFSGRWANHPFYPTIHTRQIPHDWSADHSLAFWAWSDVATGEQITLAVTSDSSRTPWKDYLLYDFTVNWTGWRHLVIPFTDFRPYAKPVGWGKVDAVSFFTKIFDREPNPYTVLYLDDLRLLKETAPTTLAPRSPAKPTGRLPHHDQVPEFDPSILNHAYPEIRASQPVRTPFQYQPYFRAERALYGYYPKFQPGFVSFSPTGKAYVRYGSYIIETRGPDGKWTYRNLLNEVIEPYARQTLHYVALDIMNVGQTDDATIRFDKEGDAYMMFALSDSTKDWRSRVGLLLYSNDGMKTWHVYRLPWYMARFEKFVGHNYDCLNRPPAILLSRYFGPTTIYLTVPEKLPDGALVIPRPVKIADQAMAAIPHSGEGSQLLTHGDQVFIVYGQLKVLPGHKQADGAPSYAVTYNLKTKTLSRPVFLGLGGRDAKDEHNWPVIAVDSRGILHVIINGHHAPFVYTHSLKPWDISAWSTPEKVAKGTSYGGLVCDRDDTLYSVTRNSDPGYYFRLSLHRKKAGQPWEAPRNLVVPFKPYYKIWYHKLVLDPVTQRLFLSYYSQSASICVFKDEFLAYLDIWPDREKAFLSAKNAPPLPLGTYCQQPRKYEFYSPPASELTTIVSTDHGDTWRLATSEDF